MKIWLMKGLFRFAVYCLGRERVVRELREHFDREFSGDPRATELLKKWGMA